MPLVRRNHGLNHSYWVDDAKWRGVTTILRETMPKPGFEKWAAEVTADYAVDNIHDLAAMRPSQARKKLLRARFDDRDAAANRGTQVHRLAVDLVHGREVEPPGVIAAHVASYRDWLDAEDIEPIAAELVVCNRSHCYCGSVDLIAWYRGHVCLIDLVTSRSGVFPEKALQTTGYRWCETYTLAGWDGAEKPLADLAVERTGVVWITADGCEYRQTNSGPDAWDYFRHLAWLHEHRDLLDMMVGVPDDPA